MATQNSRLLRPILLHRNTKTPLFGRPRTGRRFVVERSGLGRGRAVSVSKKALRAAAHRGLVAWGA